MLIGGPLLVSGYVVHKYVFETPRFYYFQRKFAEAKETINKICRINRKPRLNARLVGELGEETYEGTTFFAKRQVPPEVEAMNMGVKFSGYLDLFKHPQLRKVTIALLYIWFFRNFTYYGLNFSLPALGTEVYQNFTIAAFAETFASLLVGRITLRMGRKLSLLGSVGLVSLACLLIIFFPIPDGCYLSEESCYQKWLAIIFAIVKFQNFPFLFILLDCEVLRGFLRKCTDHIHFRKLSNRGQVSGFRFDNVYRTYWSDSNAFYCQLYAINSS